MKHLLLSALLLAGLAGCDNANKADLQGDEAAISGALKKQLDDPASYQSVSFRLDDPWTKKDSSALAQLVAKGEYTEKYLRSDSAKPAGHRYQHEYRAKNKLGGLVLTNATAVIYPEGKVVIMPF